AIAAYHEEHGHSSAHVGENLEDNAAENIELLVSVVRVVSRVNNDDHQTGDSTPMVKAQITRILWRGNHSSERSGFVIRSLYHVNRVRPQKDSQQELVYYRLYWFGVRSTPRATCPRK